jgi:hypothetical protein
MWTLARKAEILGNATTDAAAGVETGEREMPDRRDQPR